ncbi:MAG: shikimate dehydrogenase [Spirochaetia bacterium]|nr:shikimate dehydrogenase [Spirochaetia bacterium]
MLCLTLTETSLEKDLLQFQKNRDLIDMAELRIDLLGSEISVDALRRFPSLCDKPVILTCRRKKDGGLFSQSERVRVNLLKRLASGNFAYCDLEDELPRGEIDLTFREKGTRIIRSFHDMTAVPGNLFTRMQKIAEQGEIPKAAVMPNSFADTARIFEAKNELQKIERKIIIGMGNYGVPTRILYKKTGSFLTFCSAPGSSPGAPGHLNTESLRKLYRSDQITDDTSIYGIIGNPVMHSASPAIHNPGYHRLGIDAVYVPFMVDSVRTFFPFAEWFGIKGFSVTVPHKQNVLPYLGNISREVKQIGSCNTVVRTKKLWKGINTDYYGFLHPIHEDLEMGHLKRALVIGAGGAARSVVWALRNFGCSVYITNRTFDKAERLAAETGSSAITLQEASRLCADEAEKYPDLIIQTTSAGMDPDIESDPLPEYKFTGEEIVYELVYKPRITRFLNRAIQSGCRIVYGYEMLYAQGIQQFKSFTGFDYPQN